MIYKSKSDKKTSDRKNAYSGRKGYKEKMNRYLPEGCLISTQENKEYISTQRGLEKAKACGKILEGIALMCSGELSLSVELGDMRGIIPREEALYSECGIKDIAVITRVGKPVCFKVIGFDTDAQGRQVAILSRRAAQIECMENYIMKLRAGDIIDAKVTHMEQFGAFVDIGCGIASLLSIDCISVSRISHPRDRFFIGMQIKTVVKSVERESGRVYISHKELLGTWEENARDFKVGQTVAGIVRSVEEYGVFVELAPNLAGLAELREDVKIGQRAAVFIKNIIPERMKIKLVIIDCGRSDTSNGGFTVPKYFVSDSHMDSWVYSPDVSPRRIESIF